MLHIADQAQAHSPITYQLTIFIMHANINTYIVQVHIHVHACTIAYCIHVCTSTRVFDKLIWHTIGPKSSLFCSLFWPDGGTVNYDYIVINNWLKIYSQ